MSTPDPSAASTPDTPPTAAAAPPAYYTPPQYAPNPYAPNPSAPNPSAPAGWSPAPQASAANGSRRGLALTAVILGALPLVGNLFQPFVLRTVVASGGYAVYTMISAALGIVGLVLGVAALVCGLLSRRDAPLPAGIGIGVGVALIASALTGLLYALTSYL